MGSCFSKSEEAIKKSKIETLKYVTKTTVPLFSLKNTRTLCKVVDVYDGDTCKIVFWFNDKLYQFNCRLAGINTPELKNYPGLKEAVTNETKEKGLKAKDKLINLVTNERGLECNTNLLTVSCGNFDKYGRLLIDLYNDQLHINSEMIKCGFAVPYNPKK